jgi:hypothetical protein
MVVEDWFQWFFPNLGSCLKGERQSPTIAATRIFSSPLSKITQEYRESYGCE